MFAFTIVGHVDHGKSTLIGRLLYDTNSVPKEKLAEIEEVSGLLGKEVEFAYLVDHLKEEREKNITIDTAQTFFKSKNREYVIIDAPGHKEFIKNMITGASQAEAAVLIVDVVEGVKEQTKRHAYVLRLLGINKVIVVINKMDLVDWDEVHFKAVASQVREYLASLGISPIMIIPISAKKGDNVVKRSDNMPWYKGGTLLEVLDSLPSKNMQISGRGVFSVQGRFENMALGRVEYGEIRLGPAVIYPSRREVEVKQIREWNRILEKADTGKSVGIEVEAERGEIVVQGFTPQVVDSLEEYVFWFSSRPLEQGDKVEILVLTQEVSAVVEKIEERHDAADLKPLPAGLLAQGEVAKVSFKLEKPLVISKFSEIPALGRFAVVKDGVIQGGGKIS